MMTSLCYGRIHPEPRGNDRPSSDTRLKSPWGEIGTIEPSGMIMTEPSPALPKLITRSISAACRRPGGSLGITEPRASWLLAWPMRCRSGIAGAATERDYRDSDRRKSASSLRALLMPISYLTRRCARIRRTLSAADPDSFLSLGNALGRRVLTSVGSAIESAALRSRRGGKRVTRVRASWRRQRQARQQLQANWHQVIAEIQKKVEWVRLNLI
jgi:hypothetical protein